MRVLVLVLVGSILLGAAGCEGTTDDDDSPTGESRCEDLCETFRDCGGANLNVSACVGACVSDAENAASNCIRSFEDVADCVSDVDLDCDAADAQCVDEAERWVDDCDDDFRATLEVIVGGSGNPCSDTCAFAYDGYCDEPSLCPAGTDASDCGCQ